MPKHGRPAAAQRGAGSVSRESLSPKWRRRFVEHLAQSSNVTQSAVHAGISTSLAYRARKTDPDFAEAWLEALYEGYLHLEMEVLRRLRAGDLIAADGVKYDFTSAIRLLTAHRESAAHTQAERANVSAAEVRASIDRKIEDLRRRSKDEVLEEREGE